PTLHEARRREDELIAIAAQPRTHDRLHLFHGHREDPVPDVFVRGVAESIVEAAVLVADDPGMSGELAQPLGRLPESRIAFTRCLWKLLGTSGSRQLPANLVAPIAGGGSAARSTPTARAIERIQAQWRSRRGCSCGVSTRSMRHDSSGRRRGRPPLGRYYPLTQRRRT